jgi:anti-sigma regulatory factor (Ser/Thr protein kinase)
MKDLIYIAFPISPLSLQISEDIFEAVARGVTHNQQKVYHIRIILSELFSNAYLHSGSANLDGIIEFKACFSQDRFYASIINEGKGFTEAKHSVDEFPSGFAESGRGIKIVRRLCDKVEFKKMADNKFGVFVEVAIPDNKSVLIT